MLVKLRRLWSNEFLRGGAVFTIASFIVNLLNYFYNFIVGRSLGPQTYSEIATLFSYLSITAVPTSVLSTYIVKKISSAEKNKFQIAKSLETFFWQHVIKWRLVIIIALAFSPFVSSVTNLNILTGALLIPMIILAFIAAFYSSAIQGLRLFFLVSIIGIFATFIKLFGAIISLFVSSHLVIILIFVLLSMIIPFLLSFFILRSHFKKKVDVNLPKIEKKMQSLFTNRQFLLILFSTLALALLNNADVIWVKKFLSPTEAGIYGSWSLFAKIILYAIGPFISISFIFFASDKNKQHNTFNLSLITLIIIAVVSYVVYANFSSLVINIFFGDKFIAVSPYLSQASIFGSLYAAITFINGYYIAKGNFISLLLPILMPVYLIALFFIDKQISSIILLNIIFASVAVGLYLLFYLRSLLYANTKAF